MDDEAREQRMRELAHRIWEDEGQPSDQAERHWEKAREIIEEEDRERRRVATGSDSTRKGSSGAKPV
jgi:Protein of unknown function (DUF2934)